MRRFRSGALRAAAADQSKITVRGRAAFRLSLPLLDYMLLAFSWVRGWRRSIPAAMVIALLLAGLPRSGVAQPQPAGRVCPTAGQIQPTAWRLEGNEPLNAMRATVARTLQAVETRPTGATGEIVGFRAGANYGLIYARDSATISPAAQFLYDLAYLTRPVEEFLHLQYDGWPGDAEDEFWPKRPVPGALSGVIGGSGVSAVKTLVTSDEEPSVINMAYAAFKAGAGPIWLTDLQAGKPRIQRLNEALEWLMVNRFVPELGLIKRGHTTDWGDVEVGAGAQSGPASNDPKEWTASIYDQAWTYRSLLQLAEMSSAVGRPDLGELQLSRARTLRQGSSERLWQTDRGFYRTHIHLPRVIHEFDEDGMVSIANAVAVYSGLADRSEHESIFKALEDARVEAGARKPGLSLQPPYPPNFFDYPQMWPGRYQNGAVWDWWGGIQISAEFWNGFSNLGRAHLDLVARDWATAPGQVLEWQEPRTHRNGGSPAYAGAASTMAEAVIAGLFGIELGPSEFALTPRLGAQSGGIHAFHPSSGCWLDYWHTYAGDRIALEWDTNHVRPGEARVLLPERATLVGALLDQKPAPVVLERLAGDVYAVLNAPAETGKHRLELTFTIAPAP